MIEMHDMAAVPSGERPSSDPGRDEPTKSQNMPEKIEPSATPQGTHDPGTYEQKSVSDKGDLEDAEDANRPGNAEGGESGPQPEPEDESQYPKPAAMAIIMTAISMAMFLVSLVRRLLQEKTNGEKATFPPLPPFSRTSRPRQPCQRDPCQALSPDQPLNDHPSRGTTILG